MAEQGRKWGLWNWRISDREGGSEPGFRIQRCKCSDADCVGRGVDSADLSCSIYQLYRGSMACADIFAAFG